MKQSKLFKSIARIVACTFVLQTTGLQLPMQQAMAAALPASIEATSQPIGPRPDLTKPTTLYTQSGVLTNIITGKQPNPSGKTVPHPRQYTGSPSPYHQGVLRAVTPEQSAIDIASRNPVVASKPSPAAQAKTASNIKSLAAIASNTVSGPASIDELVESLKSDPDLIYQYVYNNVDYIPMFGEVKGPLGAIIDGAGTDFDQSALLVTMLTKAGYTANFQYGQITLTAAQATNWLGVASTDCVIADNFLTQAQIPHTVVCGTGNVLTSITMNHVWVNVVIGGTTYAWDPSFKTYAINPGQSNVATLLGYVQSTFVTNSESGGTVNANYVQNLNPQTQLQSLAGNLVTWIKANKPGATMDDILGGKTIPPVTTANRITHLAYEKAGDAPTTWTGDVPSSYKIAIEVQFPGIDYILTSDQYYGHRLDFTFDAQGFVYLMLDDQVLASAYSGTFDVYTNAFFTFTHNAYSDTSLNHTANVPVYGSSVSTFAMAFGPTARNNAEVHRAILQQNIQKYGQRSDFDPVTGESEAVLGQTWAAETTKAMDILERLNHSRVFYQSRLAVVTQFDTPGISISDDWRTFASQDATYAAAYTETQKLYAMGNLINPQIEAAAIRQVSGVDAVSVPVLFTIANAAGIKIYHGTSANWSASVVPNLTGYTSDQITSFYDAYISTGQDIAIPANGAINQNNWTGYGLIAYGTDNACCFNDYFGTLHGGTGTQFIDDDQISINAEFNQPDEDDLAKADKKSDEPIDLASGNYLYDHTDLVIGSQSYPYSLNFTRSYNSGNRYTPGPLGLGWTHNFATTVQVNSDGFLALGEYSAMDASASIAALYVTNDFATSNTPFESFDRVVLSELSLGWMYQQITGNTVVLTFSDHSEIFVKLADGTYSAPPNNAAKLTLSAGVYTYTTPQQVKITFNTLGQISTQTWPNGMTVTFNYNASNQLISVTNGLNRTLTLGYTNGYVTSVSDGTGRTVYFGYDSTGSLSQFQDALGQFTTFQYDQPGRLFQIFRPANPTTFVVRNTYDTLGRIASQTNANNQTWNYYFAGSRSEEVDPLSNKHALYYNNHARVTRDINALSQETDTVYDGMNRITSVTLPEGNQTQYVYDAKNNVLTKTFVPKSGSGLSNVTNIYTYDATYNKVHTFKDGRTNITTYNYDAPTGNLLNIQYPVVAGSTPSKVYTYNAHGQVLTYTDETGIVTKNTYDTTGGTEKLLTSVLDFGTTPHLNVTTTYGYDAAGNVNSITDPNTHQTLISYDALRRRTQITAPSPFNYVTKYGYDGNGNTLSIQKQTGIVATPWQTITYTYSLTDKLKSIVDPAGNSISNGYDNGDRLSSVTDADGRTTTYQYDALSRPYTVTDPSNTIQQTKTYTSNGLLYQLKDSRNNTTTYSYDGFDRLNKTTYPDASFEQNSSYDANANVLIAKTRSGGTFTNTYDSLNRLSTKSPTAEGQVTYTYDLASRLKVVGKPTVAGDPSTGNFSFNYDTAGRLQSESTPDSKQTQYARDSNGNVTKVTYPDGYYVTRAYDQINRLTDLYLNGSGVSAAHFANDQLSRTQNISYNNGTAITYAYSLNNDLSQLTQTFVGSSVTFNYGFNKSHQATSQTVSDATYLWHPGTASTVTYATANTTNQYPSVNGTAYTYDGNGNLKTDGIWTYTFDTENHLTTAVKTGVSASYVYDPLHRQAQKIVGSTKSRYVYGGTYRIADYDGTAGTLQNRYIYADRRDLPVMQVSSSGTVTYFHQDRLNSVIAVSSASGAVLNKNTYSGFGESSSLTATGFGYTGQRYDPETGLYYYKSRQYSPSLGRFLQPDPIGYRDGLNFYAYVGNDPVNHKDSSGTSSLIIVAPNGPGGMPGGATVDQNIALAQQHQGDINWFINQVQTNGPMDYKQQMNQADAFGNFNYGATGSALGLDPLTLLAGAGVYQIYSDLKQGSVNPSQILFSFGDNPSDQMNILLGILYQQLQAAQQANADNNNGGPQNPSNDGGTNGSGSNGDGSGSNGGANGSGQTGLDGGLLIPLVPDDTKIIVPVK